MRILTTTFCAIVALASGGASATTRTSEDPVWLFHTGQSFLEIEKNNPSLAGIDSLYVAAMSDTLNVLSTSDTELAWVPDCTMNRQALQLTEMFKKWLRANPERWHEAAPILFLDTLRASCGPR